MKRTLNTNDAIVLYRRVMEICEQDDAVIEIDGKVQVIHDLSYEYLIRHLSSITYIESYTIPDSRLYASNLVQIIISLSMRRDSDKIIFIRTSEDIVVAVFNTLMWCLENGYNAAIQDVKKLVIEMSETNKSSIENI